MESARTPRLEPAASIVRLFGGEAKVAEITGAGLASAYSWQYPRERRGTGGSIPQWHCVALLDYARANDVRWPPTEEHPDGRPFAAEDFLQREPVREAS